MSEPEFEVGKFYSYRATKAIHLGFIDPNQGGYDAQEGEVLQYDGTTIILRDKREFTEAPQLRGAVRQGWFVPVDNVDAVYRPKSAGIEVRGTEQRGRDKPSKHTVETVRAEEDTVGSVADRKAYRERRFAEVVQRPPLETDEAIAAMDEILEGHEELLSDEEWDCGDAEINEVAQVISDTMQEWLTEQHEQLHAWEESAQEEQEAQEEEEFKQEYESDLISLLNDIESEPAAKPKATRPKKAAKKKVAKKAAKKAAPRSAKPLTPTAEPAVTVGSGKLKMPVERQERLQMPVHRADETENSGEVVGTVSEQRKMKVEREQDLDIKAAPARPEATSPKPQPRVGGAGVMVVDDDQMDLGKIGLSTKNAATNAGPSETAKARPRTTEGINMGDVEVGHRKSAKVQEDTGDGVVVGRILSPTHRDFKATDANTSTTAIQRAEQGRQLPVEHYTSEKKAVATGDVEEAQAGDELPDILPDAVTPPKPAPKVYERPEDSPAYQAVKALIPDFEWDMDRPVKERVKHAMKFVKKPQYLKGILAVETDLAKEDIKKELAKVLQAKQAEKAAEEAEGAEA